MSTFNSIKAPFSKYEISESGTVIRNAKTKAIVSLEKGTSVRLINDSGERVTVNKKDFQTKLITGDVVEEKTEVKPKLVKKAKLKVEKAPKAAKVKKVKKERTGDRINSEVRYGKKIQVEKTARIKAILEKTGSKASKMPDLFKETKSISATASLLGTHYSYVYNSLNGLYK